MGVLGLALKATCGHEFSTQYVRRELIERFDWAHKVLALLIRWVTKSD